MPPKTPKEAISERSSCSLTSFKVLLNKKPSAADSGSTVTFRTRTKKLGSKREIKGMRARREEEEEEEKRSERLQEGGEEMSGEGKEGETYANDKVWLAVGGISCSGGNMCVGTNCRQEFIRLVVR